MSDERIDKIEGLKKELKQTQKALKQTKVAYQMATQISQFKTGFLARTSHELRSPLSSLLGLHQLILSDLCESPEEEKEFLDQAYHAAQKLLRIIDDIIIVSKLEYGSVSFQIKPTSLTKIFADVEQFSKLQANNRNLKLIIVPPPTALYVMADADKLVQALVLLVNAAISKMDLGKIRISASPEEDQSLVKIDLEIDCSQNLWQEPIDLLSNVPEVTLKSIKSFSRILEMSPGMKFHLAQTLLTEMGGNLELLEAESNSQSSASTWLQYSLPLVSAEVVVQFFVEDSSLQNYT